ncbi:MAG: 4-phosphopantetheinyl transferase family protein [Saprospiraceae bacterium]|jgi:phosphopantetheinyl transferase|nr:4-phosphopantetheinyl transferase family protein [Saprospiraceae bacterium]MCA0333671.1 4'-phosphopantetheinyl transferase superfamily protein [Bacteroidota bacterium]MCB0604788.1 4-phosphopantetheinyl transferase family protein [Saprospiraceae bacterium]MCO5277966.1 4'-phosphopantetheinyl transferase superfamily protein [Saprospiraceae bacterium]HMT78302.1 4'-phosphopantetheinyl transferase superfamily protein [Saprospiraceae bacterium]
MPAIDIESRVKDLDLYLWDMQESLDWFRKETHLTMDESNEFETMSGKRKLEFIVQRYLLCSNIQGIKPILMKMPNGKPYLSNRNEKISISHSKSMLIVSIGSMDHGVDLEWIDERIIRLASKFCNEAENKIPEEIDPVFWFTLIWSCKEALYKVDGLGQLEFRSQLAVHFTRDSFHQGWGRGKVRRNNVDVYFRLYFEKINGFVVTWAWPLYNE